MSSVIVCFSEIKTASMLMTTLKNTKIYLCSGQMTTQSKDFSKISLVDFCAR